MKILYVTRDLRDGDFVEHELTRLVPSAQLSVLPSADEVINRLHTVGQRDVVLVDQASLGNESLELLKKVRAAGAVVHIVVLVGVADQNSPDQVVQAGADECVVKSAGYMERLARILQRFAGSQEKAATPRSDDRMRLIVEQMPACVIMIAPDGTILALNWAGLQQVGAQRLDQVVGRNLPSLLSPQSREPFSVFLARVCAGQPSFLEFEWSGFDGVARKQLLKGVPFNREPGTTAATLGVISDVAPTRAADLASTAESLKAAQAQCAALERQLAEQEEAEVRVVEKIQALRAEWDVARQDLERRVKDAEEQRASLAALLESTRAAAAEGNQERSRWESTLQDLEGRVAAAEGQCKALEQALSAAETARTESAAQLESERSSWQAGIVAVEQKLRQSEEHRGVLNAALTGAEQTRDALSAELAAERERIAEATARLEASEKARAALQAQLEEDHSARQQQAAAFEDAAARATEERKGWDVVCRQLQDKLEDAAAAQAALETKLADLLRNTEEAEARRQSEKEQPQDTSGMAAELARAQQELAQLREEKRRWDEERKHAEEKRLTAEEELKAGREREFGLSMLLEGLQLEKTQWGTVQADLEERRILVEAERTGLQQALEAAASVQARLTEELKTEHGKLATERAEKEQLQKAHAQLTVTADELAQALEQAKAANTELLQFHEEDKNKLEDMNRELDRLREALGTTEAALQAHASAEAQLADLLAQANALLESERQETAQLRGEQEHLRRRLLDTGKRYRELIRSRSEGFRQTLNAGVARLQQIAESRVALLVAQHREELERLQQLVREGNLRQQDLDALLAAGEQTETKLASGTE